MIERHQISTLVPYCTDGNAIVVYLQRRDLDAPSDPDAFGFFGGHVEVEENPEGAMLREIKEELDYIPMGYEFLGKYEHDSRPGREKFVYYVRVDKKNFEGKIKILEGQYGKWFSEAEALGEPKIVESNRIVLKDLFQKLKV